MENTGSSGYDHIGRTIGNKSKNILGLLSRGHLDAIAEDSHNPMRSMATNGGIPCSPADLELAKRSISMTHNQ